jgi:hypothetical protein
MRGMGRMRPDRQRRKSLSRRSGPRIALRGRKPSRRKRWTSSQLRERTSSRGCSRLEMGRSSSSLRLRCRRQSRSVLAQALAEKGKRKRQENVHVSRPEAVFTHSNPSLVKPFPFASGHQLNPLFCSQRSLARTRADLRAMNIVGQLALHS